MSTTARWILYLVVGLFAVQARIAQAQETARLNVDVVRVRQDADLTSPIVFSLTKGAVVDVLKREGVWAQIRSDKRVGYVRLAALLFTGNVTAPEQPSVPVTPQTPIVPTSPRRTTTATAPTVTPSVAVASPSAPANVKSQNEPQSANFGSSSQRMPSHLIALGLSVTPHAPPLSGAATSRHLAGHLLIELTHGVVGLVGDAGAGTGDGYQSLAGNAGIGLAVLRSDRARVDVIGGAAYYLEQTTDGIKAQNDGVGAMAGGLLQVRLPGRLRAAVMGTYVVGKWQTLQPPSPALRFFRVVFALGM